MKPMQITTTVEKDGVLVLQGLPYPSGQKVEVSITPVSEAGPNASERYPLRGTPYRYDDPFEPVGLEDWEALP